MKIKALRTLHGSYGLLAEGETTVVKDALGKELVDAGLAKQMGDDQPEDEDEKKEPAKTSVTIKENKKK